jgi:Arc/MetJ family transcription regulator
MMIIQCLRWEFEMRTTLILDDDLLARAADLTGIAEKAPLVREALTALIARESAKRLALLGGIDPAAGAPPRRRPEAA